MKKILGNCSGLAANRCDVKKRCRREAQRKQDRAEEEGDLDCFLITPGIKTETRTVNLTASATLRLKKSPRSVGGNIRRGRDLRSS